jgi:hypothetical protein
MSLEYPAETHTEYKLMGYHKDIKETQESTESTLFPMANLKLLKQQNSQSHS